MSTFSVNLLRSRVSPMVSFVRYRFHRDPGNLETRLFRAVTEPILPPSNVTSTDRYTEKKAERRRVIEEHPYRKFLRQRAKEEIFDAAEGRMMLIYLPFHHKLREIMPVLGNLHSKGIIKKTFPNDILREVAAGTKWEKLCDLILEEDFKLYFFIGDADPAICKSCIKITKKVPFMFLIGGVIGSRILNASEVMKFSVSSLEMAHCELLGNLESLPGQTLSLLSSHQNELSTCLDQLASPADSSPPTDPDTSKTSE